MTIRKFSEGQYIYSTGEVATICRVACRTVSKWIDSGRLEGYKLPGSSVRRVKEDSLIKFMREFGLAIPTELAPSAALIPRKFPKDSFVFFKDGSNWCCVRPDHVNLQESNAGFGISLYEAQQDLIQREAKQ